jgi:hypothetical protein
MAVGHGALAETHTLTVNKHPMLTAPRGPLNPPGQQKLPGIIPGHSNGIYYHGGPVMLGPSNAYVIWYGNWPQTSTTPGLVQQFLEDDGPSPYFNINTTYYDGLNRKVTNDTRFARSVAVGYTRGSTLSDADVEQIVSDTITSGLLPPVSPAGTTLPANVPDPNGVYFVLTSADVNESSGFLTLYCGWHSNAAVAGADTKYAFVGDASRNLSVCAGQTAASPNDNPAGDAMVNVIAHEFEESVTDPDLNAWYDFRGNENADKCAWKFGSTSTLSNGAKYNMTINGHRYLIQQNWLDASGGLCALAYNG